MDKKLIKTINELNKKQASHKYPQNFYDIFEDFHKKYTIVQNLYGTINWDTPKNANINSVLQHYNKILKLQLFKDNDKEIIITMINEFQFNNPTDRIPRQKIIEDFYTNYNFLKMIKNSTPQDKIEISLEIDKTKDRDIKKLNNAGLLTILDDGTYAFFNLRYAIALLNRWKIGHGTGSSQTIAATQNKVLKKYFKKYKQDTPNSISRWDCSNARKDFNNSFLEEINSICK